MSCISCLNFYCLLAEKLAKPPPGWKPGMPVELPPMPPGWKPGMDLPLPPLALANLPPMPPGWKPGDPVPLPSAQPQAAPSGMYWKFEIWWNPCAVFPLKERIMYKHKCSDIDVLGLRLCYYPEILCVSFAGTYRTCMGVVCYLKVLLRACLNLTGYSQV